MIARTDTQLAQLLIDKQTNTSQNKVRAGRYWRYLASFASSEKGVHIKRYGTEQVMLSGVGTVSPRQCVSMGFYLIELSESLEYFDVPATFKEGHLAGRVWNHQHGIKPLCMADYRRRIHSNSTIRLQLSPNREGNIDLFFNGITTPSRAREIGAYLCSIGQQQQC